MGTSTTLPPDPMDGVLLENDVLGVRIWGPPTSPTLSLGAADIWDRRWFAERQPLITLDEIRKHAMAGSLGEVAASPNRTAYRLYNEYDFPCPKPGAQLVLRTPFGEQAAVVQDDTGVTLTVSGGGKRLAARVWVALDARLVAVDCETTGLSPEDFSVRVYRHQDTIAPGEPVCPTIGDHITRDDFDSLPAPEPVAREGWWGVRQRFHPEQTFPAGFEVVAAATLIGASAHAETDVGPGLGTPLWAGKEGRLDHGTVKRYTPINEASGAAATARLESVPKKLTFLATVATSHDGADALGAAEATLQGAVEAGIECLAARQAEALKAAQRPLRPSARVGEDTVLTSPTVVLPLLRRPLGYYGDVPLCSVASTKHAFQDSAIWHADFHLNEIRAEGPLTLGRFEDVALFADLIRTLLPQAEENARDAYGLPGAMYPLVHFPLRCRGIAHTNLTWELDIGLNGLVAKPLWLLYRHTGDADYLREAAYPVLRSCSRFCLEYLSEGEDGRLHIVPTVSPEHWGITAGFERNRDCTSALTLTKYLFRAAAAAARDLDVDASEAGDWIAAAERLVDYPTHETADGPIWTDVEGAPPIEYNIPVPLTPVFWGDDVGLDGPPDVLEMARRTLEHIDVWVPHRGYLDSCIRPRLGVCATDARIGPENLLLSYQSLRLFPAVPDGVPVSMENLCAEGGFRVSAERTPEGEVRNVRILSTRGGTLRLTHPVTGDAVTYETKAGEVVEL